VEWHILLSALDQQIDVRRRRCAKEVEPRMKAGKKLSGLSEAFTHTYDSPDLQFKVEDQIIRYL
jgi:hypothetical protein